MLIFFWVYDCKNKEVFLFPKYMEVFFSDNVIFFFCGRCAAVDEGRGATVAVCGHCGDARFRRLRVRAAQGGGCGGRGGGDKLSPAGYLHGGSQGVFACGILFATLRMRPHKGRTEDGRN